MSEPVVRSLHVYPVKSLAGCAPDAAWVEPWGLAGDRRWALVDASARVVTQRRHPLLALARAEPLGDGAVRLTAPGREPLTVPVPEPVDTLVTDVFGDKVEAIAAAAAAHAWFGEYLGAEVRLVHLDDPARRRPLDPAYARAGETVHFGDSSPVHVITVASLDALNSLVAQGDHADEGPLPMTRFRPNLVVTGTAPWAEDGWRRIAIGDTVLRVTKPCGRCVISTTDQHTASRGKEPLRTLARHRRIKGVLAFGQYLVPERTGRIRVGDTVTVLGQNC